MRRASQGGRALGFAAVTAISAVAAALSGCLGGNILVYRGASSVAPPGSARIEEPPRLLDHPPADSPGVVRPEGELQPRGLLVMGGPTAAITLLDHAGFGLDAGFLYDWNPDRAFPGYTTDSSRNLWGFGLGAGSRLLSWGDGSGPHIETSYAEVRFGAIELGSTREFENGWGTLGAGWAWDPSRHAHGPSESLCMNNYCARATHFLGQGTEIQILVTLPAIGLRYWSD
jgi:hypothetical protein